MNTARLAAALFCVAFCDAVLAQPGMPQVNTINRNVQDRVGSELNRGQAESAYGRLIKPTLTVTATRGQVKTAIYQRSNGVLLQHFADGKAVVWDFSQGAQADEFALPASATPVYYDTTQNVLYALVQSRLVRMPRAGHPQPVMDGATAGAVSGDGKWLFAGTQSGEVVKMGLDGTVAWRRTLLKAAVRDIAASADGAHVTAVAGNGEAALFGEATGATVNHSRVVQLIGYSNDQVKLLTDRGVAAFPLQGGAPSQQSIATAESVAMNAQGDRFIAIQRNGRFGIVSGTSVTQIDDAVKYAAFLDNKRYLYVKTNGVAYLRSLDVTTHYLLSIVPSASGWVVVDHQGRYDGTVVGSKDVVWKADNEVMTLDQFFEAHFQPGLLSAYLQEQEGSLSAPPSDMKRGVFPAPKVELDLPEKTMRAGKEFKVVAVAQSRGGEFAGDIRMYYNGKRLAPKNRIGSQVHRKGDRLLLIEVFAFVPVAGLNEIYAEVNNQHGVTGRSEVKKMQAEGARPAGKVHVIGIGVDKYRVSSMNLSYAVKDVSSLVERIQRGAKGSYTEVVSHTLYDERATKANIKALLDALRQAAPHDAVIMLLAGHGDNAEGEWYFLPHDLNPDAVPATGVSARDIQDALVGSPAGSIFLVVDACHSGAGVDSFNRYRNFQRRFAQQMGRSTGVAVLTAARRDQYALESKAIGHGLFTHTVLAGLQGAADLLPRDNKVSAHEIARYVAENLRERALQISGVQKIVQEPAHFVIGADFLVSDVQR
jgi:hypothetical protein